MPVGEEPPSEGSRDTQRVHNHHQAGVGLHRRVDGRRAGQAVVGPQVGHSVVQSVANECLEYGVRHRRADNVHEEERIRKMLVLPVLKRANASFTSSIWRM